MNRSISVVLGTLLVLSGILGPAVGLGLLEADLTYTLNKARAALIESENLRPFEKGKAQAEAMASLEGIGKRGRFIIRLAGGVSVIAGVILLFRDRRPLIADSKEKPRDG